MTNEESGAGSVPRPKKTEKKNTKDQLPKGFDGRILDGGSNIWTNLPSGGDEVQEVEEVDPGGPGSPAIYVPVEKPTEGN